VTEHAVIGYVHDGNTRAEFTASLLGLAMEGRTHLDAVIAWESGPNISTARNMVCSKFLAGPTPWLLMADTDMVFAADALDRLIAAADPSERPVLGGLCFQRNPDGGDPLPVMLELAGSRDRLAFARVASWPDDAAVRVSATGAAFLLIHRDVLEAVEKAAGDTAAPWFRESGMGAPLALLGEDLTFCLRCAAADIPVHVHTGVRVGHMKTGMLGTVR
jgi:GT2 family glycosyltransferase